MKTRIASPTFQISGNDSLRATQVVKNFTNWAKKEIRGENEVRDREYYENLENGDKTEDNLSKNLDPNMETDVKCDGGCIDADTFLLSVLQKTLDFHGTVDESYRIGVVSEDELSGFFLQLCNMFEKFK